MQDRSKQNSDKPRKRKKNKPWSNWGDGLQVYDVCFEVDRMDHILLTEGADSRDFVNQKRKTVDLINSFNSEVKGRIPLNISKCRNIVSSEKFMRDTKYFNLGKKVAGNRGSTDDK